MLMKIVLFVVYLLLLAGCASTPLHHTPQQVPTASHAEPPTSRARAYQAPEVIAYREPVRPSHTVAAPGKAVQVLMARSKQQEQAGQLVAAASSLERALRIEPKNALLWNRLAHVRLKQKQYALAASLASKSNAFAAQDQQLRSDNNSVIAQARQQ
jgi:tetratricopeptide (TPR) repeat protein